MARQCVPGHAGILGRFVKREAGLRDIGGSGISLSLLLDGDAGPLRDSFERVWIVEGLSHPCRDPIHLDDGEGFRPSINETVKDAIEILRRMRLNEGDRWGRA